MKLFLFLNLLSSIISYTLSINGTKRARNSSGLVFQSVEEAKKLCILLGCKTGNSYFGTNKGECFSVKRCQKCKHTQKYASSTSYCSVIPSLTSEVTIFQGALNLISDDFQNSNANVDQSEYSSKEDENDDDLHNSENSQQEEDEDENEEENDNNDFQDRKNNKSFVEKAKSEVSNYSSNGHSFLQLVSQMSSLEADDYEDKKVAKKEKKGFKNLTKNLFGKMLSKKAKSEKNQTEDKAAIFKKGNKFSFKFGNLKQKFWKLGNSKKKDLDEDEKDMNDFNSIPEISGKKILKKQVIEWGMSGQELNERLSSCLIVDGYVPITVHTFFQYFNIKKTFARPKKFKYSAFELLIDIKCKEDELCTKPSVFIGRLTPRQKLVMSNSFSIPLEILKNVGIKKLLENARVIYKCKSPKCLPEQYNSCVKVTCALNSSLLQEQEWRKVQNKVSDEREKKLENAISDEINKFREKSNEILKQKENHDDFQESEKKMNGPLSFDDVVPESKINNTIEDNLKNKNNEKDELLDSHEQRNLDSKVNSEYNKSNIPDEGEIINAPSDQERSIGLEERLKRSLGVSEEDEVEEKQSSNTEEEITEERDQKENNLALQPEISLSQEINQISVDNRSYVKKVIYITMILLAIFVIIGGIIYVT